MIKRYLLSVLGGVLVVGLLTAGVVNAGYFDWLKNKASDVLGATILSSRQVGDTPANGDLLQTNGSTSTWVATSTLAGGMQTPWLQNINAAGFTLSGNSTSGGNLTLQSTEHATKGKILFGTSAYDEVNNWLGIGTTFPTSRIHGVTTLSAATGNEIAYQLNYTTNKATSGNDTGFLINQTDTASPGTSLLIDAQVGGVSKFSVSNAGNIRASTISAGFAGQFTHYLYNNGNATGTADLVAMAFGGGSNNRTAGQQTIISVTPTYNQTSGTAANTDLLINRTETAVGSGAQLLIDAQVGGVSKFKVDNGGIGYFANKLSIGTTTPTSIFTVISQTATTTIDFGDYASTTNKTCFNIKTNTGTNGSFYFTTSGQVFENNLCR